MILAVLVAGAAVALGLTLIAVAIVVLLRRRPALPARQPSPAPLGKEVSEAPAAGHEPSPSVGPSGGTASPAPAGELVAVRGPMVEQRFSIPETGLTIGRHADNDVVLAGEPMVSRHHAVLAVEDGQHVLYDRESVNGTWVNERRVFRCVLAPGDRLHFWQSEFVYAGSAAASPEPTPLPMPADSGCLHEGESFDDYQIEALIGRGGMSEVYRARDPEGRTVAIKMLRETDPYVVGKFVQEGNQIGPLLAQHPGIVCVYRFARSVSGCLYIVMEYVQAPSLRRLLPGPLPEPHAVRVVTQVCAALAFAHQHGIIHRDIKPENVLVTADGVKILDFGIAKLTSTSTVTRGKIVGTPEYLSPEQAHGDPVQPASDVYSVGVMLYEMLCGSVPFPRDATGDPLSAALEVVRRHLHEPPPPLRERNPSVYPSPEVEAVVMRALDKDAEARYRTALEMGQALQSTAPAEAGEHGLPAQEPQPPAAEGCRPGLTPASLRVVQGPRQGRSISLGESLSLGRAELGSTNQAISRQHVTITFQAGSYWLQDRSRNGTWVDDWRVEPGGQVCLRPGSRIIIGDNVLELVCT